jgi:alpha-L-rhamnosidase
MVEKNATTVWELWNGDTADPAMNSGNHVMLVGDLIIWMFEHLAGIQSDPDHPGFKHILMKPHPVGDLTFVRATHRSPYGLIRSAWQRDARSFTWEITVPVNCTATVYMPADDATRITVNGQALRKARNRAAFLRMEGDYALLAVGSGTYKLVSRDAR